MASTPKMATDQKKPKPEWPNQKSPMATQKNQNAHTATAI